MIGQMLKEGYGIEGHCGLPRAELIGLAGKLLEVPARHCQVVVS